MRKVRDERCHTYETNPLNVKSVVLIKVGLQIAFTSARSQHSRSACFVRLDKARGLTQKMEKQS